MAEAEPGLITVRIPELEGGGVRPTINVIDAQSLALVTTGVADEQIEVPPGQYVVSSTLPSGARTVGVTDVAAGCQEEVSLSTTPPPSPLSDWQASPAAPEAEPSQFPRPARGIVRALESLGVRSARGVGEASDDIVAIPDLSVMLSPFFLRYVGLRHGVTKPVKVETEMVLGETPGLAMVVTPHSPGGVVFAQLIAGDEPVLNVALPADGQPGTSSCQLTVSTEPLTAVVSRPDNEAVDAVARYLNNGNLREAATVAAEAEHLLEGKTVDPFGAALGALALLRMGELERLHDWPRNLANWFRWLPDGAIVAGELAAQHGDYVRAIGDFCDAAERGLPVFADGFSILVSRLREYDRSDSPPGVSSEELLRLSTHAQRLIPLSPIVDYARISLALRGARLEDPLGSLDERPPTTGADGWQRFSPLSMTLERCS